MGSRACMCCPPMKVREQHGRVSSLLPPLSGDIRIKLQTPMLNAFNCWALSPALTLFSFDHWAHASGVLSENLLLHSEVLVILRGQSVVPLSASRVRMVLLTWKSLCFDRRADCGYSDLGMCHEAPVKWTKCLSLRGEQSAVLLVNTLFSLACRNDRFGIRGPNPTIDLILKKLLWCWGGGELTMLRPWDDRYWLKRCVTPWKTTELGEPTPCLWNQYRGLQNLSHRTR